MITVPVATPVTPPVADTEALAALPLLHVPPVPVVVKVAVVPLHSGDVPLIVPALGDKITDTGAVVSAEPQLLVRM